MSRTWYRRAPQKYGQRFLRVFTLIVVVSMLVGTWSPAVVPVTEATAAPPDAPKNVIILIGDGMGFNHVKAAEYYSGDTPVYADFPVQLAMSTYEADDQGYNPDDAWSDFDYVNEGYTDSASAATAMSTGVKTYSGAIGVGMDGKPLMHIFEWAEAQGKMTGVVSSVQFSHATPAAFVAHNVSRNNYTEITDEMVYTSTVDVIMGMGNPTYDNDATKVITPSYRYISEATWTDIYTDTATGADADGDGNPDDWTLIDDKSEFDALVSDANPPARVIGIPQVYSTLQQSRESSGGYGTPGGDEDPYVVPLNSGVPSLETMTKGALNVLDEDEDGFYIMIEGGAIDWASHANQSGRMIEEQIDFNHAVEAVVDWVETNSSWDETLVIVTADHETGYLTGADGSWMSVEDNGAGKVPTVAWNSGNHTNSLIPFYAKGKWSNFFHFYASKPDPVRGEYIDNTDIYKLLMHGDTPPPEPPTNVIIMISDGQGYNHVDAASYFQYGETGHQVYESFPYRLAMSTFEADDQGYDPMQAWSDFDYVMNGYTDSASAATAMSAGIKTYGGAIGVDLEGKTITHLFEKAEADGKMTGVVSSVEFSHATPAAFVAHNTTRNDYAGIANEMIYNSAADVIMGAGNPDYDNSGNPSTSSSSKYVGGDDTWEDLTDDNRVTGADADGDGSPDDWTFIDEESEFEDLASSSNPPTRVIGVPRVYQTLQQSRGTSGGYGSGGKEAPYAVPFNDDVPSLATMTEGALNVLDKDDDGFYLMVEGGAVDWASHANQSGRMIEEQIDFNHAVEAVVEWVETNSSWDETLLIVTADHETGYLTGGEDSFDPVVNNGKNKLPTMAWNSGDHTNSLIPIYIKGKGARFFEYYAAGTDPVRGRYITNIAIPRVLFEWEQLVTMLPDWIENYEETLPNGVAAGDVTQTSAVLWTRSTKTGTVTFEYGTSQTFSGATSVTAEATDPLVPVKVKVEELTPGTTYSYRATSPDGDTAQGTFRTPAATSAEGTPAGLRFGVSGDWRGELAPFPSIANADDRDLDFFVSHGDTIYADYSSPAVPRTQAETLTDYRQKNSEVYESRLGMNTLADLRASTAIFATIDDHEVTNDFSGGAPASTDPFGRFGTSSDLINDTDLYDNGLQAFQEYNPMEDRYYGNTGDSRTSEERKLYRYQTFGNDAAVFVLDNRSFRDPELPAVTDPLSPTEVAQFVAMAFDPTRTMLGAQQVADLKADLMDAQEQGVVWKFVMVAEPIQNLGVVGGQDRFEGYAYERAEILKYIKENNITNVVFVAADVHGTVVNDLTYQEGPGKPHIKTNVFEITTGAVAFDAPFGPTVVDLADGYGLISPTLKASYQSLDRAGKDQVVKQMINDQVVPMGYSEVGLDDSRINATLVKGDYVAVHTYGWTEFEIAPDSGELTVTTYGIDPYTESQMVSDPTATMSSTIEVVSQFTVTPGAKPQPQPLDLRVLHTNDHHSQLEPMYVYGYGDLGGISRRKTLIDMYRAQSYANDEMVLVLDAGDVFQGSLYYNQYKGQADLSFYNAIGYDAMTVGNHEFDDGPGTLADFIEGAEFPLLSANMVVSTTSELDGMIKPYEIFMWNGEKVGVFGLTTPETSILSSPGDKISFNDPIKTAQQVVAELEGMGVNKIIALTHQGYTSDVKLAEQVGGIDIVVGGHSHTRLGVESGDEPYPTVITDPRGDVTLVVSNWDWGKFLGNLQVSFDASGNIVPNTTLQAREPTTNDDILLASWSGSPITVSSDITPDPAFEAKLAEYAEPINALKAMVIGQTEVMLDGERNNVRSKETNLGNLITDAMLDSVKDDVGDMPVVAIMNGGGIRASIPAGDVTVAQVRTVLPFGNTVVSVDLTGAQVKDALENGVSQAEEMAGRFPQVGGLRFTWNISNTVGSRITSIEIADSDGVYHTYVPSDTYRVVTNNYMVAGGDGYSVFAQGTNQLDYGYDLADVLQDYIAAHSPITDDMAPADGEGRIGTTLAASDSEVYLPMILSGVSAAH